jgi:hypothetical protein
MSDWFQLSPTAASSCDPSQLPIATDLDAPGGTRPATLLFSLALSTSVVIGARGSDTVGRALWRGADRR